MVELNYDNNAASVFGVTLLLFYLVPAVWYILHRVLTVGKQQKTDDVPDLGQARTKAEADKLRRIARSQKPDVLMTNSFKVFILVTSLLGLLFLFLLLRSSGQAELAQYDPYAILGLGHDATEQEINKAYRKLARTYHPDMPTGDVDLFQKLKKAHDALTDPVVKENFRLYGNPDGRQAMEVSIGLPNFLKGGSGWLLVLMYVGVLVVLVPVLLCWFHRQNKDIDSGTGLHRATLFWLQNRLLSWPEGTRATLMPEIIAGCREFDLKEQPPKEEVQRWAELQAAAKAQGLPTAVTPADPQKQRNLQVISPEVATRNMLVLLHHCNRRRMPVKLTPDLILAQLAMLKSTPRICDYLVDLCCRIELETLVAALRGQNVPERAYFEHAKAVLEFQQWATQGLWEGDRSLRQLFPQEAIDAMFTKANKGGHKPSTLEQFLSYPAEERPILAALPDAERAEVERVIADLPQLRVEAKLEVLDCEDIQEADVVTATITLKHANLEGDDAPVPPVHAPSYHYPRPEEWWVFLVDERSGRGGRKRLVIPTGPKPTFAKVTPKKATTRVRMEFQAPPKAGEYVFTLYAVCTGYVDLDVRTEIPFTVAPRRASAPAAREDGEEGEEDGEKEGGDNDIALENLLSGAHRDAADYDSDLEGGAEERGEEVDSDSDGPDADGGRPAAAASASAKKGAKPAAAAGAKKSGTASGKGAAATLAAAMSAAEAADAAAAALLEEEEGAGSGKRSGKAGGKADRHAPASAQPHLPSVGLNTAEEGDADDGDAAPDAGAGGQRGVTGGAAARKKGKGKAKGGKGGAAGEGDDDDIGFSIVAGGRK